MENKDNKKKGVWMDIEIFEDENLNFVNKHLLNEIISLHKIDKCWASNEYFSNLLKLSKSTISKRITELSILGYIETKNIYANNKCTGRTITPLSKIERIEFLKKQDINDSKSKGLVVRNRIDSGSKSKGLVVRNRIDSGSKSNTINIKDKIKLDNNIKDKIKLDNNTSILEEISPSTQLNDKIELEKVLSDKIKLDKYKLENSIKKTSILKEDLPSIESNIENDIPYPTEVTQLSIAIKAGVFKDNDDYISKNRQFLKLDNLPSTYIFNIEELNYLISKNIFKKDLPNWNELLTQLGKEEFITRYYDDFLKNNSNNQRFNEYCTLNERSEKSAQHRMFKSNSTPVGELLVT